MHLLQWQQSRQPCFNRMPPRQAIVVVDLYKFEFDYTGYCNTSGFYTLIYWGGGGGGTS